MTNEKDNKSYNKDNVTPVEPPVLLSNTINEGKYSYILKKSEKLAAVLYKLTELISDKDEIKWDIRELSSRIVADLALESISRSYNKASVLYNTSGALAALTSLCAVCQIVGYISEMNFHVIRSECEALIKMILGENEISDSDVSLRQMFEINEDKTGLANSNIKDTGPIKSLVSAGSNNNKKEERAFLSSRQEMILRHIRKSGESAIKDITPNIPGCSEKTVQRDLVTLVALGLLRRSGERRWSRYSLI